MKFIVDPKIFEEFDNPRVGVIVAKGIKNTEKIDLSAENTEVLENIRSKYKSKTLSSEPEIAAWREAYRKFGAKPKEYPSSIEALYKRILKGQDIGEINPPSRHIQLHIFEIYPTRWWRRHRSYARRPTTYFCHRRGI